MKGLFYIVGWLAFSYTSAGQQIRLETQRYGGMPFITQSNRLFLAVGGEVWVENLHGDWPSVFANGDGKTIFPQQLGVAPIGNPIVGAWKSADGNIWLANAWLPGSPFASTGGLIKVLSLEQAGSFQLYNSLVYAGLQSVKEQTWWATVPESVGNKVWLSSDSGLRRLDVNTLSSTLVPKASLPYQASFRSGRNMGGKPFFKSLQNQWVFIDEEQARPLVHKGPGGEKSRFVDCWIAEADTLLVADTSLPDAQSGRLYRKDGQSFQRISILDSLALVRKEKGDVVWVAGARAGLFRLKSGQVQTLDSFATRKVLDLVIDSLNQKWVLTAGGKVFSVNDVVVGLKSKPFSSSVCAGNSVQFEDSSSTLGEGINRWLWDFGDGATSSERNPAHTFPRPGVYDVVHTAWDQNGATNTTRRQIQIFDGDYSTLISNRTVSICQNPILEAHSLAPLRWTLPVGAFVDSSSIVPNQPGMYKVSTLNLHCPFIDSVEVLPAEDQTVDIELYSLEGVPIHSFPVISIYPAQYQLKTSVPFCAYDWKTDGDLISIDSLGKATVPHEGTGQIRVTVCAASGCRYIGARNLEFGKATIPNMVTNNGDQKNDVFLIPNTAISSLTLYNRWGQEVFTASPYRNNWPEGDAQPGTYFYRLEAGGKSYTGWVQVAK